jgi:hypothetical protein
VVYAATDSGSFWAHANTKHLKNIFDSEDLDRASTRSTLELHLKIRFTNGMMNHFA